MVKQNTLQIKILSGYILLTILVLGIISAVWYEKQVLHRAETEELAMLEQRKLSNNTFKSLFSLFIDNERATFWDEADLLTYQRKEEKAFGFIEELREVFSDPLQQARIDTVKVLLEEKKKQIWQLVELPSPVRRIDSILAKKLPVLTVPVPVLHTPETEEHLQEKKKRGIFSWLKRKEKTPPASSAAAEKASLPPAYNIRKLQHEVSGALQSQEASFAKWSDSLEVRNRILNRNIDRLVNEVEVDAMQRTVQRQETVSELREEAFVFICLISSACLLGMVLLYILICKDVRQKFRYQHELENSDRRKQELLEQRKKIMLTLAHDIRGPLNSINGSAELASDTREKKKRNALLENIRSSCEHILHLVNNLLDVYRLNEGKDAPNLTPFRLNDLMERIMADYGTIANGKGLLFDKVSEGTEVTVKGDADRIEQIASNLLSNAVKFTPSGAVRFAVRYGDNTLSMEVTDTGTGMTEEDTGRIFYPFERGSQLPDADGFGLGLSITQSLVKLLDGSIRVKSELGKGSTFTVRLPLPTTAEEVTDTVPMQPADLPAGLKILAIDDDPMQLHIVKEMLERNGISCDACIHVRELVEKLRVTDYHLILSDIQMKGTNGFDLLKLLRSARLGNSQSVPVVAMTAREDARREAFAHAGFAGCIYKPFSIPELLHTVGTCAAISREATPIEGEADLSALTADVKNPVETLAVFIRECRHDREELQRLLHEDNREEMRETVHRLMPLWEMTGTEKALLELSAALRESGCPKGKLQEAVKRVLATMEGLIAQAETEKGKLENERDTDS